MKRSYFLVALLCPLLPYSQPRSLGIGDLVPDIELKPIINYKAESVKLGDFNNKLLLLDFWRTKCSPCLRGFSKLDSLQQEFGDKLQVLLVNARSTRENRQSLLAFFSKQKRTRRYGHSLPSLVEDTILEKMFPHGSLPHYVWIKNGRVMAITSAAEVTTKNIRAVIQGEPLSVKMKIDILNTNIDSLVFNAPDPGEILWRSIIRREVDGIPSSISIKRNEEKLLSGIQFTNIPLLSLYKKAFQPDLPDNRIQFSENLSAENTLYCYELTVPPMEQSSLFKLMQQDLSRYFPYKAEKKKMETNCWVLSYTRPAGAQKASKKLAKTAEDYYDLTNKHPAQLVILLEGILNLPVVNETAIVNLGEIRIPRNLPDARQLKLILEHHGFYLEEAKRELDVFVISDLN